LVNTPSTSNTKQTIFLKLANKANTFCKQM